MTISAFPTPTPSRAQAQDVFDAAVEAFLTQLPTFVSEANAVAVAMNLNSTTDTSVSSNAIGTGAKTFTVTAGKSFQPGMWLVIADTAAPTTNAMFAQVTSYSGTTLVVNSYAIMGSGTKTAWVISQSAPAALEGLYATVNVPASFATALSATSGTFTNASATMSILSIGKLRFVTFTITIVDNGTAAGAIVLTIPAASASNSQGVHREDASTGNCGVVTADAGSTSIVLRTFTNTYPGATGYTIKGSISYYVA